MRRALIGTLAVGLAAGCLDLGALRSGGEGARLDASDEAALPGDGATTVPEGSSDGGAADAPIVVPPTSFALQLAPPHVTLDPGESTKVIVNVLRGTAFQDSVDLTVQGLGADLTTNPPTVTILSTSSSGEFTIVAGAGATAPQDISVAVLGVSKRDTAIGAQADLGVRIGSLFLATGTSTTTPLPAWATELVVKVWGAGGGAGGALTTVPGLAWGGQGASGGFASARVPVDPAIALTIVVGTGGGSGQDHPGTPITPNGGGGGGYSAVSQGATMLVLAGGGGGGGGGQASNNSGQCYPDNFTTHGLGGGGAEGQAAPVPPSRSATTTAGGVADLDGGASPGASLMGGSAATPTINGGTPGGGMGGFGDDGCWGLGGGGGGGGGGFFGGASGVGRSGVYGSHVVGGGGGSGTVVAGAKDVVQTLAGASRADSDYLAPAGYGGGLGSADAGAGAGQPGRVVVRFAKP